MPIPLERWSRSPRGKEGARLNEFLRSRSFLWLPCEAARVGDRDQRGCASARRRRRHCISAQQTKPTTTAIAPAAALMAATLMAARPAAP